MGVFDSLNSAKAVSSGSAWLSSKSGSTSLSSRGGTYSTSDTSFPPYVDARTVPLKIVSDIFTSGVNAASATAINQELKAAGLSGDSNWRVGLQSFFDSLGHSVLDTIAPADSTVVWLHV